MILYTTYPRAEHKKPYRDTTNMTFKEEDDYFKVFLDLPGYKKENVSVDIADCSIHITATSETRPKVEKVVDLPKQTDYEQITAKMENGVLEIFMLKKELTSRSITIQ